MSTIHFVGGEKGGVGKSVVARALAQLFIDRQVPFAALDADLSHGALTRYYADFTQAIDLEAFPSADQILDRALGADRRVLVDLPAQSARSLKRWMDAGDIVSFARQMNVALVYWHVTDGGYDSVDELTKVLNYFGDAVQYVVVQNQGRSTDFSQLTSSTVLERVTQQNGKVIDFPALDPAAMYKIDRAGLSFWAAAQGPSDLEISLMDRRRIQLWLARATAALEQTGAAS
jgi:hypothetical protein